MLKFGQQFCYGRFLFTHMHYVTFLLLLLALLWLRRVDNSSEEPVAMIRCRIIYVSAVKQDCIEHYTET